MGQFPNCQHSSYNKRVKIRLNKVHKHSKILALILFFIILAASSYFAIKNQKSTNAPSQNVSYNEPSPSYASSPIPSPSPILSKTPPLQSYPPKSPSPNTVSQNTSKNKSCNKPTIIITQLSVTKNEADQYFSSYSLKLESTPPESSHVGEFQINVGVGNDTYWINKIKEDKIGTAVYDIVGCDFRD